VYTKPAGGWTTTTTATAELSYASATNYLSNVAISGDGDTIVAGAGDQTVSGHIDQGAVFVYTKSGAWATTSTPTAELTASDGVAGDYFGYSVAVSQNGSMIVAGAYQHTPAGGQSKQGAVYEYTMPGGGWAPTSTYTAELIASNGAASDYLGYSVAVSADGGTIVSGAESVNSGQGAAYVWTMPGVGGWASTGTYKAELGGASAGAYAGTTVAISGDTIAVGAGYATTSDAQDAGAVYVYTMPGGAWATTNTPTAELTASDGSYEAYLAYYPDSLALSGDTIVAGTDNDPGDRAVYVWTMPVGGWATATTQTQEVAEPANAGAYYWGLTVALGGSTLVASASYDNSDVGALYVFGPAAPPTSSPTTHDFGTQALYTYGAPESFTVTNGSGASLASMSFSIAGDDPDDFFISSSTCPATLAGGASCSVHVRFGPTVKGARDARLLESDSVNGGPNTFATLTGTGGSLPQGPTGKTGKTGKAGKVELVTCTIKGKHKKCKTKLVSGPVKFKTSTARATLSRDGTVYASGDESVRNGTRRLTLHASRPLRAGRYTLTLTYRSGRRIRTTITIA
jgi:hypothetical protein